jgi:hypothetical protein
MTNDPPELNFLVERSQKELLSPYQFYALSQEVRRKTGIEKLYFGQPNLRSINIENTIGIPEFRIFLDALSSYIRDLKSTHFKFFIYIYRDRQKEIDNNPIYDDTPIKIEVSLVGKGAIGNVARLRINDREDIALKVFFEPDFVWQHGPWAEIPVGLHMKYRKVTRNMAEFLFASQDWAVWEWIDPNINPDDRSDGMTYETFAREEGLTPLNPLNLSNYNLYGIRLDPGGIQKNYFGRRSIDAYKSLLYYVRRFRKEGWSFFALYLNRKTLNYAILRLMNTLCYRTRNKVKDQR